MASDPKYMKFGASSKLIDLVISGRFHGYSTQFLALETISTAGDPVHENWGIVKNSRFGHF